MLKMKTLLECFGLSLCEKGRKALLLERSFGEVLPDVANATINLAHKSLVSADIRHAIAKIASCPAWDYDETLQKVIESISKIQAIPFKDQLVSYLSSWPANVQQMLRRPSDPQGKTAPDRVEFYKGEELLPFLPPRIPRFKTGDTSHGVTNLELGILRGLGECSEVWEAFDDSNKENPPVALKFAIDPGTVEKINSHRKLFEQVFSLNEIHGIVPLNTVHFDTLPPCFEYGFVEGYDLTSLMNDWRWQYDSPKPEAALKLMRKLTSIVAKAHDLFITHRDLKPSNILIHPTPDGKMTMWITDYGWGQIESARSLELARGGTPRGEQLRLSYRGAHTPLYASPQQQKREPADLRDDVHALGVIWYQLLKRDPHAGPPVGTEWAEPYEQYGFTESQQRLLMSCLSVRADKRPNNARDLHQQIEKVEIGKPKGTDGSKLIAIKSDTSLLRPAAVVSFRGQKQDGNDSAAMAAAAMLTSENTLGVATKAGELPKFLHNSLGMSFTLCQTGTFEMGAFHDEKGRSEHDCPQHTVKIGRSFYISTNLVTQRIYEQVMGKNPSVYSKSKGGPEHPVENVTWHEAEKFCAKLGKLYDEDHNDRRYRLPFEAEWEYACRAGSQTPYWPGHKLTEKEGVFGGNGKSKTVPVGQFPANPWGLCDVHGNVAEWCQDWFDEYYYFDSPGVDPHGPKQGIMKVTRGGSYSSHVAECRSAARTPHAPDRPASTIGFRVVLMVKK
jgi:formylglycine-generating enzyme required for sulfatase activity